MKGSIDVIVDGQWGSTGKGLVTLSLAKINCYDFVISNTTRNASHTAYLQLLGDKYKFVHLPVSSVVGDPDIIISGDATIELEQLFKEINDLDPIYSVSSRLHIHPYASIITEEDKKLEQKECRKIASTMTGTAGAKIRKILRNNKATLAKDVPELRPYVCDIYEIIYEHLKSGGRGLIEGSQGFDLSIDHSPFYPYCTSRNVDPSSFLGACGISPKLVNNIIGIVRTFPIRVGDGSNTGKDGLSGISLEGTSSGGYYDNQEELTWDYITKYSGSPHKIIEKTSLTNRIRRVFTFSLTQWKRFTMMCTPDIVYITFANYLDWNLYGVSGHFTMESIRNVYPRLVIFIDKLINEQYWKNGIREIRVSTSPYSEDIMYISSIY